MSKSKLTGIYLENFQSLRSEPLFLKFDKLTLLYGPNSAGKSAIIDALNILKATVDNVEDWRIGYLYEKNETRTQFNRLKIGAELVVGKFDWNGKQSEWYHSKDPYDDYNHQYIFDRLIGKKIQVEFASGGQSIKVACDGRPAFEIIEEYTPYSQSFKKMNESEREAWESDDDVDHYEDTVRGKLIIYKNSEVFEKVWGFCGIDLHNENFKDSYFYDLFFEDHEDRIVVNGIQFNAQNQDEFLVGICDHASDFLKDAHEEPTEEFEESYNSYLKKKLESINVSQDSEERLVEFNRQFKAPNSIRNTLLRLSDDYSKLIKGFLYQISNALNYSHVRGDRGMLDSSECVSYSRGGHHGLNLVGNYRKYDDPIRVYAEFLSQEFSIGASNDLKFKGDFVNHCFQKYIPSLKGYEIVSRTYNLTLKGLDDSCNTLIYLDIKDKSENILGFQDVGSGISYMLPIITSVWCKKLSFIEQPELHLHPKAQCELADVLIASLHLGNASVIESHSEHMLLRLGRRIRETTNGYLLPNELKLLPDDVNIYYFDPQPNGSTSVKNIRLDKHGELMDRWPGGFFSERDKELFGE
jgi:hypothetical protein